MRLAFDGCTLPVAQLGPDFLILHKPFEHPPTDAEISLTVDGQEERWRVRLPQGLRANERVVPISNTFDER
jgi:hypothetical protein